MFTRFCFYFHVRNSKVGCLSTSIPRVDLAPWKENPASQQFVRWSLFYIYLICFLDSLFFSKTSTYILHCNILFRCSSISLRLKVCLTKTSYLDNIQKKFENKYLDNNFDRFSPFRFKNPRCRDSSSHTYTRRGILCRIVAYILCKRKALSWYFRFSEILKKLKVKLASTNILQHTCANVAILQQCKVLFF